MVKVSIDTKTTAVCRPHLGAASRDWVQQRPREYSSGSTLIWMILFLYPYLGDSDSSQVLKWSSKTRRAPNSTARTGCSLCWQENNNIKYYDDNDESRYDVCTLYRHTKRFYPQIITLRLFFTAGDLLIKPQRPRTSCAAIPTRPGACSARRIASFAGSIAGIQVLRTKAFHTEPAV